MYFIILVPTMNGLKVSAYFHLPIKIHCTVFASLDLLQWEDNQEMIVHSTAS